MPKALKGVVSRIILTFLLILGIGTTSAEAVFASQNGLPTSLLCDLKSHELCSIGNMDETFVPSSPLVAGLIPTQNAGNKASPADNLNPNIAAVHENTNICSDKFIPEPQPEKQLTAQNPVVNSAVYYASITPSLDANIQASVAANPTPMSESEGLSADKLFALVNAKRVEAGLVPLVRDPAVCAISEARAPEMQSDVASGYMHRGFYARKPAFQSTENMIYMRTEEEALNWWLNSPIHRSAIYGNYKQSCVVCRGNTCSQIFANIESTPITESSPVTPAIQ